MGVEDDEDMTMAVTVAMAAMVDREVDLWGHQGPVSGVAQVSVGGLEDLHIITDIMEGLDLEGLVGAQEAEEEDLASDLLVVRDGEQ